MEKKYYLDKSHNFTSKEKADWLVIYLFDSKEQLESENWVDLKSNPLLDGKIQAQIKQGDASYVITEISNPRKPRAVGS